MIQDFANSEFVSRIGWTLLHSTWQILAIGALVGLAVSAMAHRSAGLRYCIACMGLLTMLLTTAATFAIVTPASHDDLKTYDSATPVIRPEPTSGRETSHAPVNGRDAETSLPTSSSNRKSAKRRANTVASAGDSQSPTGTNRSTAALDAWIPWCVGVWITGICLLSLWNLGGWLVVHRLRKRATSPAAAGIQRRFRALQEQMRISRPVQLLESLLVDVPMVVGWLRPVVLFPVSLVTSLTAAELDAVIAHELAHIRRHDYLINLLQTLVETLLFFHPMVWWLSRRIRIEREFCCDDAAIAVCDNRTVYAKALAAVERNRTTPAYAMSFLGADKNMTLNRVKRILGGSNTTRQGWLAGVATLLLCALLVSGVVYSQTRRSEKPVRSQPSTNGAGSSAEASSKQEKTAEQSAREQFDPRNFRLELFHHGASDKPFYSMTLSVPPARDGRSPFSLFAQIKENEARAIIDHLSQSGFFRHARRPGKQSSTSNPRYELRIHSGKQILVENLGWDLDLLRRLDSLQRVLDGQAEKSLRKLLGRLSGYRSLWTAGKAVNGLQTRLTVAKTIYSSGQPIPIQFSATNAGNEARTISDPRIDFTGLTVTDENGRKLPNLVGPVQLASRRVTLAPGKTQVLSAYDLAVQYYLRRPGRYHVQYTSGILPVSNRLLLIVKPNAAGASDGDPLGRLQPIVPRDWLLISRPAAGGKVQPGSNRAPTPGLKVEFFNNPGTSKRDTVVISVWLTKKPAAAKKPKGNAPQVLPPSRYLGKIAKWHVYIHVPAAAPKRWPTAQHDIAQALAVERKLRADSAPERSRRINEFRRLHERYKTLVLPAVQAGNKVEVERLTDQFNKSLSGNLLFVQLVTRNGPPTLHKTMISKFYGSRKISIGKLGFAYGKKPIVILSTYQDGYTVVATNPVQAGKWPDDVQIIMAIADRKRPRKPREKKTSAISVPEVFTGGGLALRITVQNRLQLTKHALELLESCTFESTDQTASELELGRAVKLPHLHIQFPKPRTTPIRAKGIGPTVRRQVAISELVIPVSESQTPYFILARIGKDLRAYSKYHHKPIAALKKAVALAAEPTWGKAVGDVQIRLRPSQSQWKPGDTPVLQLDIRNRGTARAHYIPRLAFCELILDGERFRFSGAGNFNGEASVLTPGQIRRSALSISLTSKGKNGWTSKKNGTPLRPAVGRHRMKVELRYSSQTWVSLPVDIEIRKAA